MFSKDGPVTITTIKLNVQLLACQGAYQREGTGLQAISYSWKGISGTSHPETHDFSWLLTSLVSCFYPTSYQTTHIKPCHSEPPHSEKRVEYEQQNCTDDLSSRIIDTSQDCKQYHSYCLPNRPKEHQLSSTNAFDQGYSNERRKEVFGSIACRNYTGFRVRDTQTLK